MPTQQRTDLDLEFFRSRLLEEKALAERTITGTEDSEGLDEIDSAGDVRRNELSTADNHPADVATELFLREEDMALEQNAREILDKVERALQKIEEGTYGLSDRSGQPIPKERLEAVPYATLTVDEQDLQELS